MTLMVSTTEQMKVFGYTPEGLDQEVEKYTGRAKEDFAESKLEEKRRANHPLNNVPFFQRPVNASTDDIEISTSDPDVRAFKNKFGETYTIATSPDQRVEREKLRDGIISSLDGVKGYLENPFLPNKEQVADFVKGAAVGTLEQIKQSMKSGASYGDIFGTLAGVGAASTPFKVPEGSLRLFGGVGMKGAAKDKNLKKAIDLLKKEDSYKESGSIPYDANKKIWSETGWYVDPADGQWRYFIDDTKASLKDLDEISNINMSLDARNPTDWKNVKVSDIFDHPEFYEKYPELKNFEIAFYNAKPNRENIKLLGSYDELTNTLEINMGADAHRSMVNGKYVTNVDGLKKTVLHELQHVIQKKENFVRGTSSGDIPPDLVYNKDRELRGKKKPISKKFDEAEKELKLTSIQLTKAQKKSRDNPLPGLTTKQEIEIYNRHYSKPDELKQDVTWASTAREYGVPVSIVQKAANRTNLIGRLNRKRIEQRLVSGKLADDVYDVNRERSKIETYFYEGAGGEIEARLTEEMLDPSMTIAQLESGATAKDIFPVDARAGMLEKEGNMYQYQGKYGVDPFEYEIKPRREPESTNLVDTVKKKFGIIDNVKPTEATSEFDAGSIRIRPKEKPFELEDMYRVDFDWGRLNLTDSQVAELANVERSVLAAGGGQKAVEAAEKRVQDAIDARIPAITESLKDILTTSDKSVVSLDDYKNAVEATVRFDTVEEAAESISNQRGLLNKMGPGMMDDMLFDDRSMTAFEQLPDNEIFQYIFDEGLDRALVDWAVKEEAIRKSYNKYTKAANKIETPSAGAIRKKQSLTLDDFGYYQDNPATKGREGGEDWVKKQQRYAEEDAERGGTGATKKFFNGPTTATLGMMDNDKSLFLDSKFLASLKGANNEIRDASDSKYQALLKDAQDGGFDPNQKGNKVVVGVNHKGKAYIIEGNTRVAVASELGIPSVKVEVKYWNGAETVDGPYSPQNILKYASKEPKNFAEGGDTVRPEPRPEAEVDVSPRAEAGDQFFVEQAERNKPFPNVKPKPRPDLDKNKGRTYDIYSVEIDGRETNVIEFKDGKRISAPQIQQMFMEHSSASEAYPGKQTSREISNFLEKNNPTYDEFVKHFTAKRLNKGGAMMEEQMQMAFMDEGGLTDDGMDVDPVSGNDVPSGSMAEEVRDDIPAQLSEGEYVVPADVVRYYGVKFFEDLRERAKMGLQEMEMNGRIGGEPVPAGGPVNNEELSPEEMQAIQEMMGMSQGGQVRGYQAAGSVTANQVEQQMLSAGSAAQAENYVGSPLGFSIFGDSSTGVQNPNQQPETPTFTPITLYNTAGQTRTVNSEAEKTKAIADKYTMTLSEYNMYLSKRGGGGGTSITPPGGDGDREVKPWGQDLKDWNDVDDIKQFVAQAERGNLSGSGRFLRGAGFAIAGLPGAMLAGAFQSFKGLNGLYDMEAAQIIAEAKGKAGSKEHADLAVEIQKGIDTYLEKGGGLVNLAYKPRSKNVMNKVNGVFVGTGYEDVNSWAAGTSKTKRPLQTKNVDALRTKIQKDRANKTNLAKAKVTAIKSEAKRTGKSIAEIGREKAPSSEAKSPTQKAKDEGDPRAGLINKGGLMTKGKKK